MNTTRPIRDPEGHPGARRTQNKPHCCKRYSLVSLSNKASIYLLPPSEHTIGPVHPTPCRNNLHKTRPTKQANPRRLGVSSSPSTINHMPWYSPKIHLTHSPIKNHGTMPSNSPRDTLPRAPRSTPSPSPSKRSSIYSPKRIYGLAKSSHPNPQKHRRYSLQRKRTAHYN